MSYNIAIIGATGVVGSEFLKVLEPSNISINNLLLFASEKSVGKSINFRNKSFKFFYALLKPQAGFGPATLCLFHKTKAFGIARLNALSTKQMLCH